MIGLVLEQELQNRWKEHFSVLLNGNYNKEENGNMVGWLVAMEYLDRIMRQR